MTEQVFVISDLHLGGPPGAQMCGAAGQQLLASFVGWITTLQAAGNDVHLVVAGDGVDFLAEAPSVAFENDEALATKKLERIFEHTQGVWDAFARLVAAGAKFTLMLGNHDIELSLPGPRRCLLKRLGVGRVELLYDDEALRIGRLLVEHGNRYDDWNWVDHDQLRKVRRNHSRGEAADFFIPQPGSRLVVDVMNEIKSDYPFVDLLKTENAAVPPLLAYLRPGKRVTLMNLEVTMRKWFSMRVRATPAGGESTRAFTAAEAAQRSAAEAAQDAEIERRMTKTKSMVERLREFGAAAAAKLAEGRGLATVASLSRGEMGAGTRGADDLARLRAALGDLRGSGRAFVVEDETSTEYLDAARKAVDTQEIDVVVYGHTHLVKRVALGDDYPGSLGPMYLNSGTWADLIRVPAAVFAEGPGGSEALARFAADLDSEEGTAALRRQVPTFALVEVRDDGSIASRDVYRYQKGRALAEMTIPGGELDLE